MALGAFPCNRCEVNDKLTFRVAIAGMKDFTVTRTALDQMSLLAGWTGNRRFIRFINNHCMFTLRILTASDEHAKAPLTQHQHGATLRAQLPLQNFNDMSVRLTFQRTNVIAFRIARTAEKRTMFPGTNYQFGPALRAGSFLRTENSADLAIFTHAALTPINAAYLHLPQRVILPFADRRFHSPEC